jgi:hypothetical protein
MSGDELRVTLEIKAGFGFQHPHDGERNRHQSRLGIFGEREPVGRAFENDGAELFAERFVHRLEDLPGRRKILRQRLAHTHGLAALARKYESNRHAPPFFPSGVEIGPKDTALRRSVKLIRRR